MKRGRMVTGLTNSVASNMNQTWPEDRHGFKLIRNAIEQTLPKGDVVVVLTRRQAKALDNAASYCLEMAGDGDHANLIGAYAETMRRAKAALSDS